MSMEPRSGVIEKSLGFILISGLLCRGGNDAFFCPLERKNFRSCHSMCRPRIYGPLQYYRRQDWQRDWLMALSVFPRPPNLERNSKKSFENSPKTLKIKFCSFSGNPCFEAETLMAHFSKSFKVDCVCFFVPSTFSSLIGNGKGIGNRRDDGIT